MSNSQFILPQILALIFRFLSGCESVAARIKIIQNILDLLDTNLSNIEALLVKSLFVFHAIRTFKRCILVIVLYFLFIISSFITGEWVECVASCFSEA